MDVKLVPDTSPLAQKLKRFKYFDIEAEGFEKEKDWEAQFYFAHYQFNKEGEHKWFLFWKNSSFGSVAEGGFFNDEAAELAIVEKVKNLLTDKDRNEVMLEYAN